MVIVLLSYNMNDVFKKNEYFKIKCSNQQVLMI